MSDSFQYHGLQQDRLPCLSLTPKVYSNSCSLSWWCHPTISAPVIPFSSRFQFFQCASLFKWVSSSHSVQFSSLSQSCPTLCDPMNCSIPGLPVHHQLTEFTQTHIHRAGDAIQPSHPLSSPSPPSPNPSKHQSLFQWVNSSHEVAKVLEFQLQHHSFQRTLMTDRSPFYFFSLKKIILSLFQQINNKNAWIIVSLSLRLNIKTWLSSFFRMDWLDLLAVQQTLKRLLQHHSSKPSILWHSAFFTVQLSHPYMITGKTIALTRWTFVEKVMSLLLICCLGWS